MAFVFAYTLDGSAPIIEKITVANAEVLSKGELVNLESGELDAAVSGDTALVGVCLEDCDNSADGLLCAVITNEAAVYSVVDNNVRLKGATLDIAAGGLTVTTSSNADLIVVEYSGATEPTLVTFNNTHYLD